MELLIVPFIVGTIAGFIVSAGVGPIGLTAMTKSLEESFLSGFLVGVGAAALDMFYSAIACFGLSTFLDYPIVSLIFQVLGIPLLCYLGIRSLKYMPIIPEKGTKIKNIKYHNSVLIGMSIYLANPTFLPLWVGIVGILHARNLLGSTAPENAFFAVGVAFGTLIWFYISLKFIKRWDLLSKPKIVKKVFVGSGIVLLSFAVYMIYKLIIELTHNSTFIHKYFSSLM
jgi:threonine/homoserine/homoserine lactone efflux protein